MSICFKSFGKIANVASHSFRAQSYHRFLIRFVQSNAQRTFSSTSVTIPTSSSVSNAVFTAEQSNVTCETVETSTPESDEYTGARTWKCRNCDRKVRDRVACTCGEINKALQLTLKLHRESPTSRVTQKRLQDAKNVRKRAAVLHVRKQLLAQSVNGCTSDELSINQSINQSIKQSETCDWEHGCDVPLRLLSILRPSRTVPSKRMAQMGAAEVIRSYHEGSLDTSRVVCPVHRQALLKQRQYKKWNLNEETPKLSGDARVRWKREKKLELKHCVHSHCYHRDIPECNDHTIDSFGLVHIVDHAMCDALGLSEKARPIRIESITKKRKSFIMLEAEKCQLMHLTCIQDHLARLGEMDIEEKKLRLRDHMKTHDVPEWLRREINEGLDRHDAAGT